MSKKLKIFTVLLSTILLFGITTNFTDAASNSTSKIIQNLKKQVKQLTESNQSKDKEISQLKSEIANDQKQIEKYQNSLIEANTIKKQTKDYNVNTFNARVALLIGSELRLKAIANGCLSNNDSPPREVNLTIDSYTFYFPDFEKYISNQQIKEQVISSLRMFSFPNIKVNSVTVQLPTGDLVIPISETL